MANDLTVPAAFNKGNQLAAFDPTWQPGQDEFTDGIRQGFAVVSLRGKVWRIVHQGTERAVMRDDNPKEAAASLNVVMIRANKGLAKVFYKDGYTEGNNNAPDCYSNDGVRPDRSIQVPQNNNCALCPQNVWGSQVTDQGKPSKACADSKRLALLPAGDPALLSEDALLDTLDNAMFGGAMLLRVPAASMADFAAYTKHMLAQGWPLHQLVTRISFDINMAYPKIVFEAVRPLTRDELDVVLEHREGAQAKEITALNTVQGAQDAPPADVVPPTAQVQAQLAAKQEAEKHAAAEKARLDAEAKAAAKAQVAAQAAQAAPRTRRARGTATGVLAGPAQTAMAGMGAAMAQANLGSSNGQQHRAPAATQRAQPAQASGDDLDSVLDGILNA